MGHYSHLSIEEREDIMVWWKNHESISQIARKLGRNKSSISREIKRNGWSIVGVAHLCYRASTAQRKTDVRRQACKKRTLLDDPNLRARIVFLICSRHFSPEQIAGRLHLELSYAPVSCSTIYRAIHSKKLDCELPGVQSVRRRLRHRGKRRHTKHLIERRGKIRITHELVERPKEVADRQRIGDWEGDTVIGKAKGPRLVTQVDRMSGYLVGGKAASGSSADVNVAIQQALRGEVVKTITLDRGSEFARAAELQEAIGVSIYFCLPHHPWQRGTNENTNGLIREYFPKGTDLSSISDREIEAVYNELNLRPRKRLGWKCPWEVYHHQTLHLL